MLYIDELWFFIWMVKVYDFMRENFVFVMLFLLRVELIDEIVIYIEFCFLVVLCFFLFWVVFFLLVKILNYVWIIFNKVVEIVISVSIII